MFIICHHSCLLLASHKQLAHTRACASNKGAVSRLTSRHVGLLLVPPRTASWPHRYAATEQALAGVMQHAEELWQESARDPNAWRLTLKQRLNTEMDWLDGYLREKVFKIAPGHHGVVSGLFPACAEPQALRMDVQLEDPAADIDSFKCGLTRLRRASNPSSLQRSNSSGDDGALSLEDYQAAAAPSWWTQTSRRCELVPDFVEKRFGFVDNITAAFVFAKSDKLADSRLSYGRLLRHINEARRYCRRCAIITMFCYFRFAIRGLPFFPEYIWPFDDF